MAITLDAATATNNGSNGTSLTFSHTVTAAQSNLILVVFAAMGAAAAPKSVTGVTYGGVSLTKLTDGLQSLEYNSAWYLLNPPTGANNVVITGSEVDIINGGALSFYGVDQSVGVHNAVAATGNSTSPGVTVSSATGELVVDGFYFGANLSLTAGNGQTVDYNQATANALRTIGASTQAGATSVTNSWSTTAAHNWVDIGFSLIPASSALALGAAAANAASQAAAALILSVLVAGTAGGVGTAQAALSQSLAFNGAANAASLAAGSLSQSLAMAGASAGASVAGGTLLNTVQVAGTLAGAASASATLAQSLALGGAALASSAANATLAQSIRLAGSLTGISRANADLTNPLGLAGELLGASFGTGSLSQALSVAGTLSGQSSANSALTQALPLAGAFLGASAAQGSLLQYVLVGGTLAGASAGNAALRQTAFMAGAAMGIGNASAALGQALNLAGTLAGVGQANGILSVSRLLALQGTLLGVSRGAAALGQGLAHAGQARGAAFVGGALYISVALVPDSRFYVALPARHFYGAAAARPYYAAWAVRYFYARASSRAFDAALAPRAFYVLCRPTMTPFFDSKDPTEKVVLTFDASAQLAAGETLTAITSTSITISEGKDTDISALSVAPSINTGALTVNGNTIAAGAAVQAVATGGANGYQYLITIVCNTSNANKVLALKAILPVSAL